VVVVVAALVVVVVTREDKAMLPAVAYRALRQVAESVARVVRTMCRLR
jgi:hypothetical protein